ncbi:hypothetical protein [Pyrococcus kukulkanii]|uniref:Uncharacterized protein n=1 Tax=Pyrococcus kukulkanii TaxID=1609559 RepID=A0ABV4T5X6_9EURY
MKFKRTLTLRHYNRENIPKWARMSDRIVLIELRKRKRLEEVASNPDLFRYLYNRGLVVTIRDLIETIGVRDLVDFAILRSQILIDLKMRGFSDKQLRVGNYTYLPLWLAEELYNKYRGRKREKPAQKRVELGKTLNLLRALT